MMLRIGGMLLAAGHVTVCGVLATWAYLSPATSDVAYSLLMPVISSQSVLLAIWSAFGGRPGPWRLVAVAALFVAVMLLADTPLAVGTLPGESVLFLLPFFFGLTLPCALGLSGSRLLGFTLTVKAPESTSSSGSSPRFQFTLGSMLEWIAASAVILGMLSTILGQVELDDALLSWSFLPPLLLSSIILTALGLFSLWVALADRHRYSRIFFLAALPLVTVVAGILDDRSPANSLTYQVAGIVTCIMYSLFFLRATGLRVRWSRRRAMEDTTESAA